MPDNASPWDEWRPGRNPYRRTPFQILALPVTTKGRAAIKTAIRQRRQRIQNTPERFSLFGELLDVAAVNEAEERVLEPEARLYAELCTHRPRQTSIDFREQRNDLAEITVPIPNVSLVIDPARLARIVPPPATRSFSPLIDW